MHAFDRQTDRQTDRNLIVRPRLHSMQRGKKPAMAPTETLSKRLPSVQRFKVGRWLKRERCLVVNHSLSSCRRKRTDCVDVRFNDERSNACNLQQRQVAQLSQRDRAAGCASFGEIKLSFRWLLRSLLSTELEILVIAKVPITNALVLSNLCECRHRSYIAENCILWDTFSSQTL